MKARIGAFALVGLFVVSILSSCVSTTNVHFNTNVDGAKITVDGKDIGTTPAMCKMSNAVWEDPDIVITKDGYKTLRVSTEKEIKAVNLICGILLFWPSLLYVSGPKANQNFELIQETK
jgi:hypothetical protein